MMILADTATALWSAVASSCSALTAFMVWRIQRHNWREGARPEIVIEDWQLTWRDINGEITAGFIKNCGKGPAINATGHLVSHHPKDPVGLNFQLVPIIEPSGRLPLKMWGFFKGDDSCMHIAHLEIVVTCFDLHGRRYDAHYHLAARPPLPNEGRSGGFGYADLAQGLTLFRRQVRVVPRWRIALAAALLDFDLWWYRAGRRLRRNLRRLPRRRQRDVVRMARAFTGAPRHSRERLTSTTKR
jgi:hypothetical protein